jgi:demethylmenaquinone methyltransferase / 2-methoxy-6-polyprenyl-1,4-benzoquinol methylase
MDKKGINKTGVKNLFNNISGRYDLANVFISLGIIKYWRKRFSDKILGKEKAVLDVCCGTGISTSLIQKKLGCDAKIFGVDFASEMLEVAKNKFGALHPNTTFTNGDVTELEFPDDYFDLITIVFGIRNIFNREKALKEFLRTAKPGARFVCMEFNYPKNLALAMRKIYDFYMDFIIVNLGGLITGDKNAYRHLVKSIKEFPCQDEFSRFIESCGWVDVKAETLTFSTCTIYSAYKAITS